jgi:hypothetical protein
MGRSIPCLKPRIRGQTEKKGIPIRYDAHRLLFGTYLVGMDAVAHEIVREVSLG